MNTTPKSAQVIWITGLSGSGKTSLAQELAKLLRSLGEHLVILDGDELREIFTLDASDEKQFSRQTRLKLAMHYANLCKLISSQGVSVVIATISLFKEVHAWNRLNFPNYFEVYLNVPLEVLKDRDPKGIYRRFDLGQELGVVGLDIDFDIPNNPELELKYHPDHTPRKIADFLLRKIKSEVMLEN